MRQMDRTFQRDSAFSTLSKWNLFQTYMPWFFTSTGPIADTKYIMANSSEKLCLPQRNLISEISSKMIHRNNESSLISTHLRSPNVREVLYSILFLLLVAGYIVRTHLLFVPEPIVNRVRKDQSLMIPSYMIELRKLLDRYPTSEQNSFWLKNLFLVALEQLGDCLEKYGVLAATCYGVVIPLMGSNQYKRKNVSGDWIDDKIESGSRTVIRLMIKKENSWFSSPP
ncbi:LOW QUALITY PROTEIN: hypothetical protein HID58_090123 [Brassica napus]|uniref:Ycf2 N-terminal domain-containing protein n=1 Tax=Brassica napus TaxID=3708 RepID=A0ABQ7XGF1_BRANA|nr:LOW QUALITY PROTEIN: hypothetical protein HID58_090123 [Brassica napus]